MVLQDRKMYLLAVAFGVLLNTSMASAQTNQVGNTNSPAVLSNPRTQNRFNPYQNGSSTPNSSSYENYEDSYEPDTVYDEVTNNDPFEKTEDYNEYIDGLDYRYVDQIDRPTRDGSKRGDVSISPVITRVEDIDRDDRYILVNFRNFAISTLQNKTSCSMRFVVLSTLDSKISNISVRLVWPDMETNLSFDNVNPNIDTYIDYVLVGDGCYNMDKTPNIIVNRCRVKGITQDECANKIKWLRKL